MAVRTTSGCTGCDDRLVAPGQLLPRVTHNETHCASTDLKDQGADPPRKSEK